MDDKVVICGREYKLQFPSLRQVKKFGDAVGIDPLRDDVRNIDWLPILENPDKSLEVLRLVLCGEIREGILDEMTVADFGAVVGAFFLRGQMVNATLPSELRHFADTMNQAVSRSRTDSPLTSQSIPLVGETSDLPSGSGTDAQSEN